MIAERLRWLRTKCSRLFLRGKRDAALEAELQFHMDQLIAQFREEGMSEREARLAAQREFGCEAAAYREEIRDTWRPPALADIWRSLRLAVRSLLHSPAFTLLAIITLAFGIGGNTLMFSAFHSIVSKPLPYPGSDQLDRIDRATPQTSEGRISAADLLDLQRESHAYGEIAGYALRDTSLSEPGQPADMVQEARATVNLFATLGVQPSLGRDFRRGEDVPGNHKVVIISDRTWQKRFGGGVDVVGRIIRVGGEPHEIIGVLPPAFNDWRHLGSVDLFRPLALDQEASADRQSTILRVLGRRSEKLSPNESATFIANFGSRLAKEFPDVHAGTRWRARPLPEFIIEKNGRTMIGMLIGLSAFVLLIACSNLANLLLARTMARAREFAVRAALGASRAQLLRPLLTESFLLALAGGACALVVARWGADWLMARSIGENGEGVTIEFSWEVFGWAFGAAAATALGFGLAPALFALRLNVTDTLKSGGRGATGGRGQRRFRHALIVGQFALAMVLLAGAAIFIRGLDELNNRRAGWSSDHLVTGSIVLPAAVYPDAERITAFHRLALQRLAALPGVAAASISAFTPFFEWGDVRKFVIGGRELPQTGHEPAAAINTVSPHYFDTVGTRIVAGRAFTERDTEESTRVLIVSQFTAVALFGHENPIGRRLAYVGGSGSQWAEIVGVAADVRSVMPDPAGIPYQIYQPMAQDPRAYNQIAVRTAGISPSAVVQNIRQVMSELDPDLPVSGLKTADATIERANYQTAVLRDILTGFAVLGVGLASLGIYGVIARTMAQRAPEFAIRFALGATVNDVRQIVLGTGLKLALIGAALGLVGAVALVRVLAAGNPGMQLHSPATLFGTTLLLVAVAIVACWLPARRAARINPIDALRAE